MRKKISFLSLLIVLFLMLYSFNVNADDLKVLHKIKFNHKASKKLIATLLQQSYYNDPIPESVYYERFDLNGDKQKEYFLYVADSGWCGSLGCAIAIISKHGSTINLLPYIVSSKVYILNRKTQGYYDIAFNVTKPPIVHIWRWDGWKYIHTLNTTK
jgi:hypothetical protein